MSFHTSPWFTVAWTSALICFSVGPFSTMSLQSSFERKIIAKHNIQKTHIHIFHNKLPGKVAIILDAFSDSDVVMRAKVILTKNVSVNTSTK